MVRKAIVATVVLVFVGVGPSVGEAAVFHDKDVQHELDAGWRSCGPGTAGQPCAVTQISGYESFYTAVTDSNGLRDCVRVGQTRGISHGDGYVDVAQPFDFTSSGTCGVAMVTVPGSLNSGTVRGDVPGENCHVIPPDYAHPTSCAPTSLRIALEWHSGGDIVRFPGSVSHQSPVEPDQRCLQHWLPYRSTPYINDATVTGQIDGLPAPLGDLTGAFMGFGEINTIGTVPFCFD